MANEGGPALDTAPDLVNSLPALQKGAKIFVNYCLNCHSASSMRYNRLRDIGLTDDEIKANLLFTSDKVGDLMKTSLATKDAKEWFGSTPPDLSVIARSHGADWLYTYLRTFYRDDTRPTGWNNLVFPNVGMPHVLWELQGQRVAKYEDVKDHHDPAKTVHEFKGFEQVTPGQLKSADYNEAVADLVAYLNWMSEPAQNDRRRLGVWVLLFIALFSVMAWGLNASYWKDIK
ncbi:MAG: cytochrome c1 [Candidatus Protistobacter heckmanni]|nr:cytochrome c1 [Candidatus Protistobacter heckmanni]